MEKADQFLVNGVFSAEKNDDILDVLMPGKDYVHILGEKTLSVRYDRDLDTKDL